MNRIGNWDIALIIPTLNEEKNLSGVFGELTQLGYHNVLIVDGNSSDNTQKLAKQFGANVLLQNGRGKGKALRQGFEYAMNNGIEGDIIVMMDADGSMNPKDIQSLIKALDGGVDIVKASRFMKNAYSEDMSLMRRVGNKLLLFAFNFLCSTHYTDLCYGFVAFRKSAISRLYPHLKSKNFEIEAEILIKAKKFGLKVAEVPSIEFSRRNGKSNLHSFRDGFRILGTIIKEFVIS